MYSAATAKLFIVIRSKEHLGMHQQVVDYEHWK